MGYRRPSPRVLRLCCADVGPDDGSDPRDDRRGGSRGGGDRKTRQLCGQVAEALNLALGETGDDVLGGLYIVGVDPAPDASRLLVTVGPLGGEEFDPAEALEHLYRASGRLRCEVASAITRRRTPNLDYRFALPPGRA